MRTKLTMAILILLGNSFSKSYAQAGAGIVMVQKVQLGVFSMKKSKDVFKGLPDVHFKKVNGVYKYYSGKFTHEIDARENLISAKSKGFSGAFVVEVEEEMVNVDTDKQTPDYKIELEQKKDFFENGKVKASGSVNKLAGPGKAVKEYQWKYYYESGQLKENGAYKAGKKTGQWTGYHHNGKIKLIGNFVDNKKSGEWKLFDDTGKLIKTINYLAGVVTKAKRKVISKLENQYHDNGNLAATGNAIKGKEVGLWTYYDENGNLEYTINYSTKVQVNYFKSGEVKATGKVSPRQGGSSWKGLYVRHGDWLTYYPTGELEHKFSFHYSYIKGEWITYHKNGHKKSVKNYVDGKPGERTVLKGEEKLFHSNGSLKKVVFH